MTRSDPWLFGGRYYALTAVSDVNTRDGLGLELDDVAPAPGRGLVLEVFREDSTGVWTMRSFATEALPLDLVERFIATARTELKMADA